MVKVNKKVLIGFKARVSTKSKLEQVCIEKDMCMSELCNYIVENWLNSR